MSKKKNCVKILIDVITVWWTIGGFSSLSVAYVYFSRIFYNEDILWLWRKIIINYWNPFNCTCQAIQEWSRKIPRNLDLTLDPSLWPWTHYFFPGKVSSSVNGWTTPPILGIFWDTQNLNWDLRSEQALEAIRCSAKWEEHFYPNTFKIRVGPAGAHKHQN